jgi:predicted DNA-binding transcriptional regulator YafY
MPITNSYNKFSTKSKGYGHSWSVLRRLHRLARALDCGKWITARNLADAEECTTKTIYRTIEFFRDELRWEIDSGAFGYFLRKKHQSLL